MRYALIGLGALLAAWTGAVQPSSAQYARPDMPWGPRAWCTQGPIGSFSFPQCSYYTYEQCRMTAFGTRAQCIANPYYVEQRAPVRRKVRRHKS
jgi:hypothetical protein